MYFDQRHPTDKVHDITDVLFMRPVIHPYKLFLQDSTIQCIINEI